MKQRQTDPVIINVIKDLECKFPEIVLADFKQHKENPFDILCSQVTQLRSNTYQLDALKQSLIQKLGNNLNHVQKDLIDTFYQYVLKHLQNEKQISQRRKKEQDEESQHRRYDQEEGKREKYHRTSHHDRHSVSDNSFKDKKRHKERKGHQDSRKQPEKSHKKQKYRENNKKQYDKQENIEIREFTQFQINRDDNLFQISQQNEIVNQKLKQDLKPIIQDNFESDNDDYVNEENNKIIEQQKKEEENKRKIDEMQQKKENFIREYEQKKINEQMQLQQLQSENNEQVDRENSNVNQQKEIIIEKIIDQEINLNNEMQEKPNTSMIIENDQIQEKENQIRAEIVEENSFQKQNINLENLNNEQKPEIDKYKIENSSNHYQSSIQDNQQQLLEIKQSIQKLDQSNHQFKEDIERYLNQFKGFFQNGFGVKKKLKLLGKRLKFFKNQFITR